MVYLPYLPTFVLYLPHYVPTCPCKHTYLCTLRTYSVDTADVHLPIRLPCVLLYVCMCNAAGFSTGKRGRAPWLPTKPIHRHAQFGNTPVRATRACGGSLLTGRVDQHQPMHAAKPWSHVGCHPFFFSLALDAPSSPDVAELPSSLCIHHPVPVHHASQCRTSKCTLTLCVCGPVPPPARVARHGRLPRSAPTAAQAAQPP